MPHEEKEAKKEFSFFKEDMLTGREKIRNTTALLIFQTERLEYSVNKYFS